MQVNSVLKNVVSAVFAASCLGCIVYALEQFVPDKINYHAWIFFSADHAQSEQLGLLTTDQSKVKMPLKLRVKLTDCDQFSSEKYCSIQLNEEKSFYTLAIISRDFALSEEIFDNYMVSLKDLWMTSLNISPKYQSGFRLETTEKKFEQGLERSRDSLPIIAFFYSLLIYFLVIGKHKF